MNVMARGGDDRARENAPAFADRQMFALTALPRRGAEMTEN
jgi:hypothetical protein